MTTTAIPALDYAMDNCQVERVMDWLGERATVVVLREVFNGVRRFDDIHRHGGVSRQVLADRLAMLVDEGVLHKVAYRSDGARLRHEYRPTEKGLDLYPVLTAIAQYGARHYSDPEGPAVQMVHRGCGATVDVALECAAGHHHLADREVAPAPGPSARPVRRALAR